jgi:hypothetical protein
MKGQPSPHDEDDHRPIFTSRRHERSLRTRRRMTHTLMVALVVAATVTGGWLWWRSRNPSPTSGEGVSASATAPASLPSSDSTANAADLPGLDDSDAFVRPLVSALSSHPTVAAWMATDNLVHRFVLSVVDVANGRSPGEPLSFLTPKRPFKAELSGGRLVVDPSSYDRYEPMTATFVSLDTRGTARLFSKLEPLMDDAYRDLGLGNEPFRHVLGRAFGRLLAVDFPTSPPELAHPSVAYVYADQRLEDLSPAEKDLLRVGPENGRRIQAKLRELAAAMGITPVAPERRVP